MAFVRPPLVVDTTGTSGTGTYTLDDPAAPGDGFRTLADAVADGDVSAGDTISYFVVDTTTTAAALAWEHGTGTVGAGGLSLARTTVLSSSNGGLAVSWGVGGSRTVRFGAGTAGFAFLAAAQSFTALQTFSAGLTSSSTIKVESGASPVPVELRSDNQVGSAGRVIFGAHNASNANIDYGELRSVITVNTAGAEAARFTMFLYKAGVNTDVFRFNSDGTITDTAGGRTFAYQGVLSAPSGGRLLWGVVTIPAGWAIVASLADKVILTTSTASEIDDVGGSWTISGLNVDGHALVESELPAHSHTIGAGASFVASVGGGTGLLSSTAAGTAWATNASTATTGSDSAHSHGLTADGVWRPAYYKAGWIAKT